MTESEFLTYCQAQVSGPLKDEDIILMLTAWGQISYNLGYNQAINESGIKKEDGSGSGN